MAGSGMPPLVDVETAIRQISRGRDLLAQLRAFPPPSSSSWSESAKTLFEQVVGASETAIRILTTEGGRDLKVERKGSPETEGRHQVSNKRRKGESTWSTFTSNPHEDGCQWRKYGEKPIQGDKYRRSYYRCSYKFDQGCPATKQVQRASKDGRSMAFVTYKHQHTCKVPTNNIIVSAITETRQVTRPLVKSESQHPLMNNQQERNCSSSDADVKHQLPKVEEHSDYDLADLPKPLPVAAPCIFEPIYYRDQFYPDGVIWEF